MLNNPIIFRKWRISVVKSPFLDKALHGKFFRIFLSFPSDTRWRSIRRNSNSQKWLQTKSFKLNFPQFCRLIYIIWRHTFCTIRCQNKGINDHRYLHICTTTKYRRIGIGLFLFIAGYGWDWHLFISRNSITWRITWEKWWKSDFYFGSFFCIFTTDKRSWKSIKLSLIAVYRLCGQGIEFAS